MKAVVYKRYGPPEVLQLEEVHKPSPKAGELGIKVRAAEVTKSDCELRSFRFPVKWFWLPLRLMFGLTKPRKQILGGYFAGEIEALGEGVEGFAVGDAVFGSSALYLGAYGQHLCLPADQCLALKPENMSFEDAAAVPLGGLNALHFLRRAELQPDEEILIIGAGGSIGLYAVQIAKAMGARVSAVDATHKEALLRGFGVEEFFDYTRQDFSQSGRRYHVVFDMVAGSSYSSCLGMLKPKGRYIIGNPRLSKVLRGLLTNAFGDKEAIFAMAGETREELNALKQMIEAGQIGSIVERSYPMEEAAAAHHRVETEQRLGAIVLSIAP